MLNMKWTSDLMVRHVFIIILQLNLENFELLVWDHQIYPERNKEEY